MDTGHLMAGGNINIQLGSSQVLPFKDSDRPPIWNISEFNPLSKKPIDNYDLILPLPNPVRRKELAELKKKIENKLRNNCKLPVLYLVISGFPGTGKTVLAQTYWMEHKEDYPEGRLRWRIRAEKESTCLEDYKNLAEKLNVSFDEKNTRLEDLVREVNRALENYPEFLLVFDNIVSREDVKKLLPKNLSIKGKFLFTSRTSNILEDDDCAAQVEINLNKGFELGDSLKLFKKLMPKYDDRFAEKLIDRLRGLPLSLMQAFSYMRDKQLSYEKYLNLYNNKYSSILQEEKLPDKYSQRILQGCNVEEQNKLNSYYAVFMLSLQDLKEKGDEKRLLNLCAYLNPDNIPRELFLPLYKDEEQLNCILGTLANKALINFGTNKENFSIHRIIQDVIRVDIINKTNCEHSYLNEVLKLLHTQRAVIVLSDLYEKRYLIPHFEAVFINRDI